MVMIIAYNVLLVACCGYAFALGGAPERIGALTILIGTVLTVVAASRPAVRFHSVEGGILLVDIVTLIALLALSLHSRRFWPLWVTGLQALTVACHVAKMTSVGVIPWVYASVIAFSGFPMLMLVAVGTWRHRVRLKRDGADPSWSPSSFPSRPERRADWPTG